MNDLYILEIPETFGKANSILDSVAHSNLHRLSLTSPHTLHTPSFTQIDTEIPNAVTKAVHVLLHHDDKHNLTATITSLHIPDTFLPVRDVEGRLKGIIYTLRHANQTGHYVRTLTHLPFLPPAPPIAPSLGRRTKLI